MVVQKKKEQKTTNNKEMDLWGKFIGFTNVNKHTQFLVGLVKAKLLHVQYWVSLAKFIHDKETRHY